MGTNQGGKYDKTSKTPDRMEDFDNLSPRLRKMARNLPYKYPAADLERYEGFYVPQIEDLFLAQMQKHALACYGPDHPQAQGLYLCPLKK